ncbi:MAG: hypothetical protein C0596_18895 [Marinilabiliales bacterium]|nr:MAG: hypothetical protein C0596_18895 [Marinilabiliales bacterium]
MRKEIIVWCFVLFACCNCKSQQVIQSSFSNGNIPITYRNHIYIKGVTDSVSGNFVFDTGATNLYFDDLFYRSNKFSYKNLKNGHITGAGTKGQDIVIIMDTVNFSFASENYETEAVPVLMLKSILGDYADGIIGLDYFANSVLEINYIDEYIKLYEDINLIDVTKYKKLKLEKFENRLHLPLTIYIDSINKISGLFRLDIGNGGCISITSPVAKENELEKRIENKVGSFSKYEGVGGDSFCYYFRADSVLFSDYVLEDVTMNFSTDNAGSLAVYNHYGLLGNGILEKFDLIIDFKELYLYIKPNENIYIPFDFSSLVFGYVNRSESMGVWIVASIRENSNASKSGLKIDDQIISINGISVSEILFECQDDFFDDVDEINLEIKRKRRTKEINIVLEDF